MADQEEQKIDPIDRLSLEETPSTAHIGVLADANKGLRRKIFDLYTIFEISRHLNSMLNVESLLDATLFTCIGQMGVAGAAIIVQDPKDNKLSHFHFKGLTLPKDISIHFSRVGRLARYLQRTARPQLIRELRDAVPPESEDYAKLMAVEAELVVPLISKGNLLGILFLPRRLSGLAYQENDLEFVSILVNQLSVAIVNAHLYQSEKEALLELRSAQKRLIESERLAALGRLAASIAHEVNNPLGIIKNYLAIISKLAAASSEIKDNVTVVSEEVDRIARIVRQLLDFYRPTLERQSELNIIDVLDATLELTTQKLQRQGVEIEKRYDRENLKIMGSSSRLKQVFLNLILNARDAMPRGGRLIVSAHRRNEFAEIEFSDTGTGIPRGELPRIFEPFFTTKKESGTGLGLAVCHGIIASHNGVIGASNNSAGGATFTIRLPLMAKAKND
jgi:two-component system sensor histidine kinase HydH